MIKRFLVIGALAIFCSPLIADVVISSSPANTAGGGDNDSTPSNLNNGSNWSALTTGLNSGISFTTGAAGNGWNLNNVSFFLKTDSTVPTVTLNSISARLYTVSGSTIATVANTFATNSYALAIPNNSGSGQSVTFNFNTSGYNGINQNQEYYLGLTFDLSGGDDTGKGVWIQGNGNFGQGAGYSGAWGSSVNSWFQTDPGAGLAGQPVSNFAFTLDATAVPEPGTLILGSIASASGLGGWVLRRRRAKFTSTSVITS